MASSSSSSSCQLKYQVFLSFRGEDTRLNFTSHLLQALKDTGINVFFDEDKLEKGKKLSLALSQAIAASDLSIIVLSADYASSKSCLAELCDIMGRKDTQEHFILPIFYHVDPSDVRNLGGSFKTSFEEHQSNRLPDEVKRWKDAFVEIGKLKGWHIGGGKFDRPEADYIKIVVHYVIKLLNRKSRSVSVELVGIDDQKKVILQLIEKEDSRVIGLWGMGGIGKTTLAEVVYNEISQTFQACHFLQNVREKIQKQGKESLRNELLSKLLNWETCIDTPSIGSTTQQRLNNMKVIVVLDDVSDSDQIDHLGVKYLGDGSKIIVTSRDIQVFKNGDEIHEVNKLNEKDSLQLFSTFAFKLLNPPPDFQDLSNKFLGYTHGNPLALKVLGSKLYQKCREVWVGEVVKLNKYPEQKISNIFKSSFDELDEMEKNIFLDIACFLKGGSKKDVEEFLSSCYDGAVGGINNLVDRCLLDVGISYISMHDMLEEMGKIIARQESKNPGERSRLCDPKDVGEVLKYNTGTRSIEGMKSNSSQIDKLRLCPTVLQNMYRLRYIHLYDRCFPNSRDRELYKGEVDIVSLSDELRYFCWRSFPFKSLSSGFNPENLMVLKLPYGHMEQLWSGDHQGLVNLREIDLFHCKKLKKIPNLSGAVKLEILACRGCTSLVELPRLNYLESLETLDLSGCKNLRKIPDLVGAINLKSLTCRGCKSLVELPCLDHLASLEIIDFLCCENLSKIPDLPRPTNLKMLNCCGCQSLADIPSLSHLASEAVTFCSSDARQMKLQLFLSSRGEGTSIDFTSYLLEALKDTGMNVIFNEENLEEGKQHSQSLSQAITASYFSIIVLSADYASSRSRLTELSKVMDLKRSKGHVLLPVFYHVDPSDVRNIVGDFKISFEEHDSKGPLDEVMRWKAALAEVGKLNGWLIGGGGFPRPESEFIEDIVEYVLKKLVDYWKERIFVLIEQDEIRVIGLWVIAGIGNTILAEAIYNEISPAFQGRFFLQDVRERIKKQGKKSLRNELLSKLLDDRIDIDTPEVGSPYRERLNNKKVFVVLDDVYDSEVIDFMGVKYFGAGSKIIVTSRDRQVLKNGGADKIHEVKMLNWSDSFQLFSTRGFKILNPALDFRDLRCKFYAVLPGQLTCSENFLVLKYIQSVEKSRKVRWISSRNIHDKLYFIFW